MINRTKGLLNSKKFALYSFGYYLASLLLFLTAANTSAAFIAYGFFLTPFYLVFFLYCLIISLGDRPQKIGLKKSAVYALFGSQVFTILTSPADCRGWHQGNSCYSFLQMHIQNTVALPTSTPHLTTIENLFPIALLAYILAMIWSLKTLKIEDNKI